MQSKTGQAQTKDAAKFKVKLDDDSAWGGAAEGYKTMAAFPLKYGKDAVALLDLKRGESVVEVACGTGDLAFHMATTFGVSVQATDFAAGMIEAGQKHPEAADADVTLRVMDGTSLEFPDGHFDAAVSSFGVFLFPERKKGLREMLRVLKPGGRMVVTSWTSDRNAMLPWQRFLEEYAPEAPLPTIPGTGECDTPEGLQRELQSIGAVQATSREVTHNFEAVSGHAVVTSLKSNPWVTTVMTKLDAEKRDAFLTEVAAYLDRHHAADAGGISYPATAVIGVAYKP